MAVPDSIAAHMQPKLLGMTTARTLSCGHRKQTGYKVGRETDEPKTVYFFVSNNLKLQSLYPRKEIDQ
jgi:hypothetical protein